MTCRLHGSGARSNRPQDRLCARAMISPVQLKAMLHAHTTSTESVVTRIARALRQGLPRVSLLEEGELLAMVVQRQGGRLGRAGREVRDHSQRVRCGALQDLWKLRLAPRLRLTGTKWCRATSWNAAWTTQLLSGPALTMHQSVVGDNGLNVWRLLNKRYDPKTTLRNLQISLSL